MKFRPWIIGIAVALLLPCGPIPLSAEAYPDRPIRLIVPYAAGYSLDTLARKLSDGASQLLGQKIIVENRPGAGTTIGAEYVARSNPDGYTLLLAGIATATATNLMPDLRYDMARDLSAIVRWYSEPLFLLVPPSLGVKTVDELVRKLRESHENITFASPNTGTSAHLTGELFKIATGLNLHHVPYSGSTMLTDLIAGRTTFMFYVYEPTQGFIKSGQLIPLATTGYERLPNLPDVPTMKEAGYPSVTLTTWAGLYAPHGTPPDIIDKIYKAFSQVLSTREMRDYLATGGQQAWLADPLEFENFTKDEIARFKELTQKIGITVKK